MSESHSCTVRGTGTRTSRIGFWPGTAIDQNVFIGSRGLLLDTFYRDVIYE